ncbi:pleckstrin homology domain-containing family M member 1 [Nilaparvata lugens]|uniref:pleckstrin homology domain-containing family M member 1 n=1 Tax=Nilaparvata lugens TaxID=108931 RepID=UPI000B990A7F|nr:pleckstrin homology domain-containing family M member 1 [Nilaparvata lugens]XP_039299044.1 pleckstrin homology domain-containing family M member 1 [Nilaparvata lugens]
MLCYVSIKMNVFKRQLFSFKINQTLVKNSLQQQLAVSVKEVQSDIESVRQNSDSAASSLIIVLEAIFIHGLKETLLDKMSQAIGTDPHHRPQPNFWAPLLIFSHRDVIQQVNELVHVTSDIGRSRAWLRVALNDGLLSSYLQSIIIDNSALTEYYNRQAFLRDIERLDVAFDLIKGMEIGCFNYACNSSLLNTWTNSPLQMAGIWTPPMKSWPIASGTDVVQTLPDDSNVADSSHVSIASYSLQDSLLNPQLMFDEEAALKIILGTPIDDSPLRVRLNEEDAAMSSSTPDHHCSSKSEATTNSATDLDAITPSETKNIVASSSTLQSYDSLLKSYNKDPVLKPVNLQHVIEQYQNQSDVAEPPNKPEQSQMTVSTNSCLDFEVISKNTSDVINIPDYSMLVSKLTHIPLEQGLASQNYSCEDCKTPLGINMENIRVCGYSGYYYCERCFCAPGEEAVIPARILYNWDFNKYPVSTKASKFLHEVQNHPMFDMKTINSRLYAVVEEMANLQALRMQLNLLRGYLFTCNQPVVEELKKLIWPREYLFEHVHLYSVADLLEISSGVLGQLLVKVVLFARDHVLSCTLCKLKGFICEVCSSQIIIYPFDLQNYKCNTCNAVFHLVCLNRLKPCPKCERYRKRQIDTACME